MATSGSSRLSLPSGHTVTLSWKLTGNQNGMYTEYQYTLTWSENSKWTAGNLTITIDGDVWTHRYYKNAAGGSSASTIGPRYATIKRSTETNIGVLKISMVAEGTYQNSNYDNIDYTRSTSGSWNIYTTTTYGSGAAISTVQWDNDEQNPAITYTYDKGTNVESATLSAGISFTGSQMDIPYRELPSITGNYTLELSNTERQTLWTLLKNGNTATVRVYLRTTEVVAGETMHIDNYLTKTISFINYTPLLKPTIIDTNTATKALTGDANKLIRYMSKATYAMNVELRKGALDVIGCYIQNGGVIQEGFENGTFDNPTSNTFYFSATDDRGYTGTSMYSLSSFDGEFVEYIKLTNAVKTTPIDTNGELDITVSGKYFNGWFSENNPNTLSVKYRVYKSGETLDWTDLGVVTPTINGSDYTYTFKAGGLDYTKQYTVEVQAIDRLMTVQASVKAVARPVFYWSKDSFTFNVPVIMAGGTTDASAEEGTATGYYMNSSNQYSSGGYTWYYKKWANGLLECWCTISLSTTVNTAWGNMYIAATQYKTDLSYPVQPVGTPVVMATIGAGGTRGMLIADSSYAADNISTGRYNIASPVAISSSSTFRINYYVRGYWK